MAYAKVLNLGGFVQVASTAREIFEQRDFVG
jgi:hypothetical protein